MTYNLDNLSLKSLEKIFLVLGDIKYNMEIQNSNSCVDMGEIEGIEGVSENEHNKIMTTLLEYTDLVDKVHRDGRRCGLDINVEKFNNFFTMVSDKIREKKDRPTQKSTTKDLSLDFNEQKSILYFRNYEIKMSLKNDKTNAHCVLKHIFNSDDLGREFDYSEIASELNESYDEDNSWRKYYRACEDIQEKVRKASGVEDFLDIRSGKTGWVKINEKYLV